MDLIEQMAHDPAGLKRGVYAKIIAERGQEWFDANKKYLDGQWEAAASVFGFDPNAEPIGEVEVDDQAGEKA